MKYVSLFAGIGGFDKALNEAGHTCVYANEWDKYAATIYNKNFCNQPPAEIEQNGEGRDRAANERGADVRDRQIPALHSVDTRSIRDVPASEIPDCDLIVGGFPCQSFSIAGKRGGFADTRGTLFYEIARIAAAKRPTYLLLENVKGLLSHDNGRTFETIMRTFDELGYELQWQVLNSKNHGVPQNRERVFIVGHLRGKPRPKIFPFGEIPGLYNSPNPGEQGKEQGICSTIDARYGALRNSGETYIIPTIRATEYKHGDNQTLVGTYRTHKDGQGFREVKSGLAPTIPARAREDGSGQPVIAQRVPLKFLERNQKNIEGDYAYTVDTANTGGVMVDMKIRRLTPVECERLQGFPDNWTAGISDTQRYKCLGNAVTVNVVAAVIKNLCL